MFRGIIKHNHWPQRSGNSELRRPPTDVNSIKAWYSKFEETGSIGDLHTSVRPRVSHETVDAVLEAFQHSPGKSKRRASIMLKCTSDYGS